MLTFYIIYLKKHSRKSLQPLLHAHTLHMAVAWSQPSSSLLECPTLLEPWWRSLPSLIIVHSIMSIGSPIPSFLPPLFYVRNPAPGLLPLLLSSGMSYACSWRDFSSERCFCVYKTSEHALEHDKQSTLLVSLDATRQMDLACTELG